jgi:hypothetical protein
LKDLCVAKIVLGYQNLMIQLHQKEMLGQFAVNVDEQTVHY